MPPPRDGERIENLTGRWRFRRSLFGALILEVEVERRTFRPIYTGHTPANWVTDLRWRDAREGEPQAVFP